MAWPNEAIKEQAKEWVSVFAQPMPIKPQPTEALSSIQADPIVQA